MISATGKALVRSLLEKHHAQCQHDAALCVALLNGHTPTTTSKRKAIVASADTIKKAGKGKSTYGPHNPHWTQTARGRKIQRKRALARVKAKGAAIG